MELPPGVPSISSLFGSEGRILAETDYQVLLLATLLPVLGTSLLSPILDTLVGPLGATSSTIGLMVSVFTAPSIVMIPLAGVLADRVGRKRVLVVATLLFGLSGTAIVLTTDFRIVLGLRFVQGIAFSGINPIIITSIGDLYDDDAEATGQGIRFTVSGLSGAVFPLLAGVLLVVGWQAPFLLYAISFPVALGILLWFDEPTDSNARSHADSPGDVSYSGAMFDLVTHRRVLSMILARALMVAVWIAFITYNSFIVVRLQGGTPVEAGTLATIGFLVFAISASQAGRLSSMLDDRLNLLLAANLCLGGGWVVVLFAPDFPLAVVGIVVAAVGFGVVGSLYRPIITALAPEALRGGIVSLSEAGGRVVATATPFVMGGIIAIATPQLGFDSAIRLAGVGVAVVSCGGSVLSLLVASVSPPVSTPG